MACELVRRAWLELEADADNRHGQPSDPVVYLARAVVAQAVKEWRAGRYLSVGGYGQPRWWQHELRSFFASSTFRWWCDMGDLDADAVREASGVEVR